MKQLKIKEVFHTIRNGANIKQDRLSGGLPVTRIESIVNYTLDLERLGYAGIEDDSFQDYYLQDGDILMSHINSISHLGKVAIFEQRNEKIIHGMNLLCLKANKAILYPKYAFYFFKSPIFINALKKITKKSVNQASMNISDLVNLVIFLPDSIETQIKIATVLSKVEVLIKERKESINLLEEFLRSIFFEMFGDPIKNEKKWNKVPLKKFGDIITGNTPSRSDLDNYSDNYIEWIKTDNIVSDNLFVTRANEFLSEKGMLKSRPVKKGALLVACIAGSIESVGRACLTDRTICFNQQINAIQPNNEINPLFLYWLFKTTKPYIQNHSTKGMKKILTKGEFEKILMIKPPVELQNQFSQIVERSEILKKQFKNSLLEMETLYASLSQRAFKGELDLSELVIDHIIPQSHGGSPDVSNLQVITRKENIIKSNKTFDEKKTEIKKEFTKTTWGNVSKQQLGNWIKKKYKGFHFNTEMLLRFLLTEHGINAEYYSSEELKKNPQLNESEDLKSLISSAVNKDNPFIKLEQVFYNAEKENIQLKVTESDFKIIKHRSPKERSGIYFQIVE